MLDLFQIIQQKLEWMFEFQIAFSGKDQKVLNRLIEDLKSSTAGIETVITSFAQGGRAFVVIACDDVEKPRVSFSICDVISDIISTFYKLEFIENNLALPINNQVNLSAFKKALIAFDRETDKYIITRSLKIDHTIYLDEFFQFRLKQLRNKWMEIIKLANDNASYLLCNDTFIDLLKFLIDNIEVSRGMVNIVKKAGKFVLCDEDFNEIDQSSNPLCELDERTKEDEIWLISSLIALSPKKIVVYCNPFENSPALTLITQIFENRISILPAEKNSL